MVIIFGGHYIWWYRQKVPLQKFTDSYLIMHNYLTHKIFPKCIQMYMIDLMLAVLKINANLIPYQLFGILKV